VQFAFWVSAKRKKHYLVLDIKVIRRAGSADKLNNLMEQINLRQDKGERKVVAYRIKVCPRCLSSMDFNPQDVSENEKKPQSQEKMKYEEIEKLEALKPHHKRKVSLANSLCCL
jgi:hypothetical protein